MRVLLFKANQLGDNLLFLPVVQELRRRYPEWELAVFTSAPAEPLYEAAIPDPANRFVVSTAQFKTSWKRPLEFLRLWWRVFSFRPDICLLPEDQANVAYLLAFLSGAATRLAMVPEFIKIGALANRRIPCEPGEKTPVSNWHLAAALVHEAGGTNWPATPPPPNLSHLLAGKDQEMLESKPQIVIHSGASRAYQCWFPERYIELANRLANQDSANVVWIETTPEGTKGLSPSVRRVRSNTLHDLARILHGASLFVGNNSGPMHIANALNCPCVIINGPTTYHWDPYWRAERMLMLRNEALPCLPCDTVRAANVCRNVAHPMACMDFWSVDTIRQHCLAWARKWSIDGAYSYSQSL